MVYFQHLEKVPLIVYYHKKYHTFYVDFHQFL